MVIECAVLYWLTGGSQAKFPDQDNPAQLKPAILFAAMYAFILFIVAWAKDRFGTGALYGIAFLSGLTDVDAVTLSAASLFRQESLSGEEAWRIILIATLSNLFFKTMAVGALGNRKLFAYVATTFGIAAIGGLAILFLWPDDLGGSGL